MSAGRRRESSEVALATLRGRVCATRQTHVRRQRGFDTVTLFDSERVDDVRSKAAGRTGSPFCDPRGFPPGICVPVDVYLDETRVEAQRSVSKNATIRCRCAASGRRPWPAPRLSAICWGLLVPGITAVTASLPRRYLRKNWPQLAASKSAAHSGSLCPRTARKSRLRANGRSVNTAAPASAAAGITRFSAARSASE